MPSYCAAYGCCNSGHKDRPNGEPADISFHMFPLRNPELLTKWLMKLRRVNFCPNKHSKICSAHFEKSCFLPLKSKRGRRILKPNAVPTKFNYLASGSGDEKVYEVRNTRESKRRNTVNKFEKYFKSIDSSCQSERDFLLHLREKNAREEDDEGNETDNSDTSSDGKSTLTITVFLVPSSKPVMSGDHRTVIKGAPSQYVKLNVGGSLHYTTIGTLTKHDSMLRAMFSGRMKVLTDSEGWILIDRCGRHFGTILSFLRDGSVPLPDSTREIAELLAEAKYYLIQELSECCESALRKREMDLEPICRVPLITSSKEEQMLINSSTKPVVKLLINRHNNKYSYTNTSDDNLLKNVELFDKLSLRFSGRVLFIKDVIGSNEICCWSFYGHGRKVAEVCCTSIVYATDKKHTKVEFPEARIYEETLNILLYENRNAPDMDLMQATSTRGAVGGAMGTTYTSDDEDDRRTPGSSSKESRDNCHLNRLRNTKQTS